MIILPRGHFASLFCDDYIAVGIEQRSDSAGIAGVPHQLVYPSHLVDKYLSRTGILKLRSVLINDLKALVFSHFSLPPSVEWLHCITKFPEFQLRVMRKVFSVMVIIRTMKPSKNECIVCHRWVGMFVFIIAAESKNAKRKK